MKRAIFLATAALLAMLVLAPVALAQDDTTVMMEDTAMEDTAMEGTVSGTGTQEGDLPESGGPAILLPAAALLLGSGILTYAVLRRR
ncbi:MAG: hypothetical protein AB1425_09915 [Actinomycetota bacterium]